jgi:hypothetical protein
MDEPVWYPVDKKLPEPGLWILSRTTVGFTLCEFEEDNFIDEIGDIVQCVAFWTYLTDPLETE